MINDTTIEALRAKNLDNQRREVVSQLNLFCDRQKNREDKIKYLVELAFDEQVGDYVFPLDVLRCLDDYEKLSNKLPDTPLEKGKRKAMLLSFINSARSYCQRGDRDELKTSMFFVIKNYEALAYVSPVKASNCQIQREEVLRQWLVTNGYSPENGLVTLSGLDHKTIQHELNNLSTDKALFDLTIDSFKTHFWKKQKIAKLKVGR